MNDKKKPKSKLGYITGVFLLLALSVPLFAQRLPKLPDLRGILSGFIFERGGCSRIVASEAQISTLTVGIQQYKTLNRALPTTEHGLAALVTPPTTARVQRKLVESTALVDPWGHLFQYQMPGDSGRPYQIWSFGPDGKNGTEDDIYIKYGSSL